MAQDDNKSFTDEMKSNSKLTSVDSITIPPIQPLRQKPLRLPVDAYSEEFFGNLGKGVIPLFENPYEIGPQTLAEFQKGWKLKDYKKLSIVLGMLKYGMGPMIYEHDKDGNIYEYSCKLDAKDPNDAYLTFLPKAGTIENCKWRWRTNLNVGEEIVTEDYVTIGVSVATCVIVGNYMLVDENIDKLESCMILSSKECKDIVEDYACVTGVKYFDHTFKNVKDLDLSKYCKIAVNHKLFAKYHTSLSFQSKFAKQTKKTQ